MLRRARSRAAVPLDRAASSPASATTERTLMETVLQVATVVVSAGAGIAALAFWFGWTITNARSSYFGIDASVLGYTATDYVLRSADAMLVPAIAVLVVTLAAVAIHRLLTLMLASPRWARVARWTLWTLVAAGVLCMVAGCVIIFQTRPVPVPVLVPPVLLGGGAVVSCYAIWSLRRAGTSPTPGRRRVPGQARWERAMIVTTALLAVVCLFWGASRYAEALGGDRARVLERSLTGRPWVIVYSKEDLALGKDVDRQVVDAADTAYRFRYSGLRLLTQSNGRHFLLTDGWSPEDGTAIVLQDSPGIRYEYRPGRNAAPAD